MKIEFEIVEEDIIKFYEHHSKNSSRIRNNIIVFKYSLPILLLIISIHAIATAPIKNITLWLIISGIWFFGTPLYYRYASILNTKKLLKEGENRGILTKHILILDSDGIVEESKYSSSKVKWELIEKIERNDKYIYVYNGSISAIIIPKRYFHDLTNADDFYNKLIFFKNNK